MSVVIRAAIAYWTLLIAVRLTGRRTVGQLAPFDLIVLFLFREHHHHRGDRQGSVLRRQLQRDLHDRADASPGLEPEGPLRLVRAAGHRL
nr:hypothetical protein [uncultured Lichenicoccus sp.]